MPGNLTLEEAKEIQLRFGHIIHCRRVPSESDPDLADHQRGPFISSSIR